MLSDPQTLQFLPLLVMGLSGLIILAYISGLFWRDLVPPLKENYKDICLKAWSMWALYISLGLQAADQLMPYFIDFTSPWYVKVGAFMVTVLAAYVRLMPQRTLPNEP